MKFFRRISAAVFCASLLSGCDFFGNSGPAKPRLVLFVGVDISGSFMNGAHFDDSVKFLSRYIYAHMNGLGGLEVPDTLFVASIGGNKPDETKTFYPKQTFEGKSIDEIEKQLHGFFPKGKKNPLSEFNPFFEQVAATIQNKNLILRPISIVMVSDGIPDEKGKPNEADYGRVNLAPLETLSRNVTVRLLYTDPVVGRNWRNKVKRKRVMVWTQDGVIMELWKDKAVLSPDLPMEKQAKLFAWIKDNVDFPVRVKRVGS